MNRTSLLISFCAGLSIAIGYGLSLVPQSMFNSSASVFVIILIAIPACVGLWMHYRYKAVLAIVLLGLFSLGIETIGIHTGFPYSYFEYTNPLGVLLFNTTPWTVAIAWSPLVIGAYMLASKISQGFWSQLGYYLILLVTLDVVLDPAAVARGLWSYTNGGEFYGVPLVNFAGWIFSGILAYIILRYALGKTKKLLLSISLVSASYIASIALWTGANIGYGQTGAWIVGVFTLLVVLKILTLPTQTEG